MRQKPRANIIQTRARKLLAVGCQLSALVLLSACILVEDFAPQWEKGKTDFCINKIAESLYYSEFRRDTQGKDMNTLAHVFPLGDMYFLMLKKDAADAGGRMYRLGIVETKDYHILRRYRLDPSMRDRFRKDYPDAPVDLSHDTVTLASLAEAEMKLLRDISDKAEYWQIEDQTLYNPSRNPLCTLK